MDRELVFVDLAVRLGITDSASAEALVTQYRVARRQSASGLDEDGVPMSFERWAVARRVWDVPALERVLAQFAAAHFVCDGCHTRLLGQQLGPYDRLTCAACGSDQLRVPTVADSAKLVRAVANEAEFAERLFAAMALHREMRYDEAMAELEMLVGFDATNTQARDLLQQTQQRHAEVMEGTRRARAAVAAGDLERAHDAYRALQERVPLQHETVAEGRRVAEALHARQEMRELLAEGDLDGAQRAADAVAGWFGPQTGWVVALHDEVRAAREAAPDWDALLAEVQQAAEPEALAERLAELRQRFPQHRQLATVQTAWERRCGQAKGERALAAAERLTRRGRLGRATAELQQAAAALPGDWRVDAALRRIATVRRLLTGGMLAASVAVVAIGVLVAVSMWDSGQREAQRQAALAEPEPANRLAALQAYLAEYPADADVEQAVAAARDLLRRRSREAAVAHADPGRRRAALERHLAAYADDAKAQQALRAAQAQVAARQQVAAQRAALRDILAEPAAAARAVALVRLLREHGDTLPAELARQAQAELAAAQLAAFRQRTALEVAGLDLWQQIEHLAALTREVEAKTAAGRPGWAATQDWLAGQAAEARRDLLVELARAGRRLQTGAAAAAFREQVARTEPLVPDVRERLRDALQTAERLLAEEARAAELRQLAEAAAQAPWYEAAEVLSEVEAFVERVPRLRETLAAAQAALAERLAERPPAVPGFEPLRIERFAAAGQAYRVHVYRHEGLARALQLPAVPDDWRARARTAATAGAAPGETAFTRPDVEFVLLPPLGVEAMRFEMGSPLSETGRGGDETRHTVRLTRPFLMARTEVSQAAWQAVAEPAGLPANPSRIRGERLPVTGVTWTQAAAYCEHLGLRLPTEAEWEFAARGGTAGPFAFGDTLPHEQANTNTSQPYGNRPAQPARRQPVSTASLPANAYGLHEMHGNVWEWCADWRDRLPATPEVDPRGPGRGLARVLRGGSYRFPPQQARSAARSGLAPDGAAVDIGMRPVFSLPASAPHGE